MNTQVNGVACRLDKQTSLTRHKQTRVSLDTAVASLCEKIRSNPGRPLTLSDMERLTGFSRRSLENEFHRQFDCSPIKWQQTERLNMAHEYLTQINGKIAVGDLAYQFGFVSSSKFIAYYKRYFKETPKDTAIRIRHAISFKGDRTPRVAAGLQIHAAE